MSILSTPLLFIYNRLILSSTDNLLPSWELPDFRYSVVRMSALWAAAVEYQVLPGVLSTIIRSCFTYYKVTVSTSKLLPNDAEKVNANLYRRDVGRYYGGIHTTCEGKPQKNLNAWDQENIGATVCILTQAHGALQYSKKISKSLNVKVTKENRRNEGKNIAQARRHNTTTL